LARTETAPPSAAGSGVFGSASAVARAWALLGPKTGEELLHGLLSPPFVVLAQRRVALVGLEPSRVGGGGGRKFGVGHLRQLSEGVVDLLLGGRQASGFLGGEAGLVLGPEQVVGDLVHRAAHLSDGLCQPLAPRPQLLDLAVQHPATAGQVRKHAGSQLLRLMHHGSALGAGPRQHVLRLELG
jgi:hypothetical protein